MPNKKELFVLLILFCSELRIEWNFLDFHIVLVRVEKAYIKLLLL